MLLSSSHLSRGGRDDRCSQQETGLQVRQQHCQPSGNVVAWPAGDGAPHAPPDDSAGLQRISGRIRCGQKEPQEQHLARDRHQHPQELQLCPQGVRTAAHMTEGLLGEVPSLRRGLIPWLSFTLRTTARCVLPTTLQVTSSRALTSKGTASSDNKCIPETTQENRRRGIVRQVQGSS